MDWDKRADHDRWEQWLMIWGFITICYKRNWDIDEFNRRIGLVREHAKILT